MTTESSEQQQWEECLRCGLVPVACVWQAKVGPSGYGCLLSYGEARQQKAALESEVSALRAKAVRLESELSIAKANYLATEQAYERLQQRERELTARFADAISQAPEGK